MKNSNAVQRKNALMVRSMLPLLALFASLARAQAYIIRDVAREGDVVLERRQVYQFTGALAIYGSGGSPAQTTAYSGNPSGAVPAQCPADHPVSCTNIQEPYYCCPPNNYCAWWNSEVSCCPSGETCTGSVQSSWQPTSTYWTPTPYPPVTTTVYGYVTPVTTTEHEPQATVGYEGYCSTLVAKGPNLPTTEAGQCGTILIVEGDAMQAALLFNWMPLGLTVIALQLLGGWLLLRI